MLPKFFNYNEEDTNNGYESIQDFFISWAIRCAVESIETTKECDKLVHDYSKRILYALIYGKNENGEITIPSYEDAPKLEVIDVKTYRQWNRIDLLAEVTIQRDQKEELIILNIENKWYSNLHLHQLLNAVEYVKNAYPHVKEENIRNIVLFCDEEKQTQYFDFCQQNGYLFLSAGYLITHGEPIEPERTKNTLFDTYWFDGWG